MDADPRARLGAYAAAEHGLELSPDSLDRLDRYVSLLAVWNQRVRLTGSSDRSVLFDRHVADSLAVVGCVPPGSTVVDIGSGAGFPGVVVLAVQSSAAGVLIEPRRRRASFLSEVARTLPLPGGKVLCARAEDPVVRSSSAVPADVVVSRAIRLDVFLALAAPLLKVGGTAVSMQSVQPSTSDDGTGLGLRPLDPIDYLLPDNTPRRLLLFRRVW